jgi:LysR family glycine cleavage system transcriptional activator
MSPVISANLFRTSDIRDPSDLATLPLLHPWSNYDFWGSWFGEYGISVSRGEEHFYDLMETAIQAAMHGLGVAMINPEFVVDELESGRLILPFPDMTPSISSYHYIYPKSKADHPGVLNFQEWLRKTTDTVCPSIPVQRDSLDRLNIIPLKRTTARSTSRIGRSY